MGSIEWHAVDIIVIVVKGATWGSEENEWETSSLPFDVRNVDIAQKYETSGIRACKHGSDGCFSTALGR